MADNGHISKDFDIVNKDPGQGGPSVDQYKGIQPRSGEAKMDGGSNDTSPFNTGSYKGAGGPGDLYKSI